MRVHSFGCGVRLPSPKGLASGGNSRGGEASAAAQPATGGGSRRFRRRWFGQLGQEDQRLKKHDCVRLTSNGLTLVESIVD